MTTPNGSTTNPNCAPLVGWLVKAEPGYYTGIERSQLERWTTFPKLARVYKRKRWAQKTAERLAGQMILIEQKK